MTNFSTILIKTKRNVNLKNNYLKIAWLKTMKFLAWVIILYLFRNTESPLHSLLHFCSILCEFFSIKKVS